METPRVASGEVTNQTAPVLSAGVSSRYAKALYEVADEARELDLVVEQAAALGRLIDESAPLRRLLASPTFDIAQSRAAVLAVMQEQGFGATLCHFVGVIASNRRIGRLRGFLSAFAGLVASRRGITVAEVSSAHPLTDLQRSQLRARLTEAGFARVDIHEHVDAALLGGLVVRVGARLYDSSVRSRLARLNHAMKGAA